MVVFQRWQLKLEDKHQQLELELEMEPSVLFRLETHLQLCHFLCIRRVQMTRIYHERSIYFFREHLYV